MHKIPNLSLICGWFVSCLIVGCAHNTRKPSTKAAVTPHIAVQQLLSHAKLPPENLQPTKTNATTESRIQSRPFEIVLPVKRLKINQRFYITRRHEHLGVDLGGRRGDPIYAATSGTVVYAGTGFHGYGKMILVAYNKKWATLYAHMNRLRVRTGWRVRAGQRIGDMGRTGYATGVHLHFELLLNKLPINPLPYLRQAARRNHNHNHVRGVANR